MNSFKVIAYSNGITNPDLKVHAQNVLNSLTGNVNFPSPYEPLTVITAAIGDLDTAITNQKPGDVASTATLHAKATEVKACLKVLALYVWRKSNGDEAMALGSGFDISKPAGKPAKTFIAKNGSLTGTVLLETLSGGRAAYRWEISADPIGVWTEVTTSIISKHTVEGLIPGVKYWFRVALITSAGKQNYSDPYMVLVV